MLKVLFGCFWLFIVNCKSDKLQEELLNKKELRFDDFEYFQFFWIVKEVKIKKWFLSIVKKMWFRDKVK